MRLDEAIVNNFDETERAALAAALGVDWAELPEARAAALVEAMGRRGGAADLLVALAAARPAVPWAELPYPNATLQRLHAALVRRHNLDGLRSLCFRLGVDFDDLPGETKDGRARELVLAMDRAGRTAELWENYESRKRLTQRSPSAPRTPRRTVLPLCILRALRALRELLNSSLLTRHSSLLILLAMGLAAGAMRADSRAADGDLTAIISRPSPIVSTTVDNPSAAGHTLVDYPPVRTPLATPSATRRATGVALSTLDARHSPVVLVGDRGANLRAGPGPGYAVVVTLRAGARLALRAVSPTGEWYQVRLPGQGSPWIDARYAVVVGRADIPVATLPALPSPTAAAGNPPGRAIPDLTAAPTPRPTMRPATPTPLPAPTSTAAAPPPAPTMPPP